jgi:hypothetical protein
MQGITQSVRRSRYIIEKSELAQVRRLREVKAQQVILQRICCKVQKLNLIANIEPQGRILDLVQRKICLL